MSYPFIYKSDIPEVVYYYSLESYSGNTLYSDYYRHFDTLEVEGRYSPIDGQISGATSFNSSIGVYNGFGTGSTEFSGSTANLHIPGSTYFTGLYHNDYAYNFFFKRKDLTSQEYWFINNSEVLGGGSYSGYTAFQQLWLDTNGKLNYKFGTDYNNYYIHVRSNEVINDTDWHMFTLYYAGWTTGGGTTKVENVKMFFNGTGDTLTTVYSPADPSFLNTFSKSFNGQCDFGQDSSCYVDEISLWSNQRGYAIDYSDDEILNIYNFYLNPLSATTAPVLTGDYSSGNMVLTWTDNNPLGSEFEIYRKVNGGAYTLLDTVDFTGRTYTDTGLTDTDYYFYKIRLNINDDYYSNYSNEVWTKLIDYTICGCSSDDITQRGYCVWDEDFYSNLITITDATCGNADGVIDINDVNLFNFFDYVLVDENGVYSEQFGYYTDNGNPTQITGLTAGYYELQVFTKAEYRYLYGPGCIIDYIPINSTLSTITAGEVIKRELICGPFDSTQGRIIWNFNDTDTGSTYTYRIFQRTMNPYKLWYSLNSPETLARSGDTWTENQINVNTDRGERIYYGYVKNNTTGCILLFGPDKSGSKTIGSVSGIKKLFITPWSSDLDWNHWKTSDEDYYLESEDTSSFFSTKIKELYSFSGGTLQWYNIPVVGTMSLSQGLSKVRQGFILKDTVSVEVPKGMIERFEEFTKLLPNKWVYVIQDSMSQWWVGGYAVGATVEGYKFETGERGGENKYGLSFEAVSSDKILTAIDENWVNGYIINDPDSPKNLIINLETQSTIKISWDKLYYTDSLIPQIYTGGTWNNITTLGDVTTYTYKGLNAETSYPLRVINTYDSTQYTSTTITGTTIISYPEIITVTGTTDNTLGISWSAVTQYCDSLSPQLYSGATWNTIDTISATDTSYVFTGLSSNTSYPVRVLNNYQGGSTPSSASTGTTQPSIDDNLIRYWKLDNNLNGYGGSSLNGSNYSWDSSGIIGQCIDLSSSDVNANIYEDDFSISFWFNYDSDGSDEDIFGIGTGTFSIYKNSSNSLILPSYNQGIISGTWYHIVMTHNGTTNKSNFWVNGVKAVTDNTLNSFSNCSVYLGYRSGASPDYFNGKIDEIGVWSRELTADNVSDLYNSGSGARPSIV